LEEKKELREIINTIIIILISAREDMNKPKPLNDVKPYCLAVKRKIKVDDNPMKMEI
jgi:hypothetical protein